MADNSGNTSYSSSDIVSCGIKCKLHCWLPDEPPQATCLIFHGFKAHARYPTVRYVAELLQAQGCIVYAFDMPGHGCSEGARGYIESADKLVKHGSDAANHVKALHEDLKLFLVGSSMGAAIALLVSERMDGAPDGIVMLAPMLQLELSNNKPLRYLLLALASIPGLRSVPVIPSNSGDSSIQYRDPVRRKEAEDDELTVTGKISFASGSACLELCVMVKALAPSFTSPMFFMIADEDIVVDSIGAAAMANELFTSVEDKTIKHYNALHGIICEPDPLRKEIEKDISNWITSRSA